MKREDDIESLRRDGGIFPASTAPPGGTSGYFWTRPKIYQDELKFPYINVPVGRTINSVIIIYTISISIDFIVSLCTEGSRFIFSVSLIGASVYWLWATWWDEAYNVPPTYTSIKTQGFNVFWRIFWLIYHTMIFGWAVFLAITTWVFTYADLREIFQWECWGDARSLSKNDILN
jgi:hypothetical protein